MWKEVYQYTMLDFIGDAGGTIGIFLGISFYSIYKDILEPILEQCLTRLKKNWS